MDEYILIAREKSVQRLTQTSNILVIPGPSVK